MTIDKNSKRIIIEKDSPVREIYINSNFSYMWRKNDTDKMIVDLGDISEFLNYTIEFKRPYLFMNKDDKYTIYYSHDEHTIQNLYNNNIKTIVFNCLEPNIEVEQLAKRLHLDNISMAEVGFKFMVTTKYLLSKLNIRSYDLYDLEHFACENGRIFFKNDNRIRIFEGYAHETLKMNTRIYDYVFFDCTHRYKTDMEIIKSLIPHLTKKTVIVFHDYTMPECHRVIDEFGELHICRTYAINNINALDKARGDIIKIWDTETE